ncbi:hypothetical protein Bca101_024321 [Brassica carinata]
MNCKRYLTAEEIVQGSPSLLLVEMNDATGYGSTAWGFTVMSTMCCLKMLEMHGWKFFLDLLWAVEPRVVNWNLVTKSETDEEKRLNATYIVSVARKLGCSVFVLPEDIVEVKHKMILILTASIMYWSLQKRSTESSDSSSSQSTTTSTDASPAPSVTGEDEVSSLSGEVSSLAVDDSEADAVSDITTVSEETPNELIDCQREFARETTILLREQRSLVINL